jgi:hypothetical protein
VIKYLEFSDVIHVVYYICTSPSRSVIGPKAHIRGCSLCGPGSGRSSRSPCGCRHYLTYRSAEWRAAREASVRFRSPLRRVHRSHRVGERRVSRRARLLRGRRRPPDCFAAERPVKQYLCFGKTTGLHLTRFRP